MVDTSSALPSKVLIMVVGPAAIGKSSIMHAVTNQDERFGYVRSFTSRRERPGEQSSYTHVSEAEAVRMHANGKTVTFLRHPTINHIYGTTIESYPARFNLLDTLSGSVSLYQNLPFARTIALSVTADPDAWEAWLLKRYPTRSLERTQRLQEAVTSIEWSLSQTSEHYWVCNRPGRVAETATQLIEFIEASSKSASAPPEAAALYERAKLLLSYDQRVDHDELSVLA